MRFIVSISLGSAQQPRLSRCTSSALASALSLHNRYSYDGHGTAVRLHRSTIEVSIAKAIPPQSGSKAAQLTAMVSKAARVPAAEVEAASVRTAEGEVESMCRRGESGPVQ